MGHGSISGVPTIPTFSNLEVSAPFGQLVTYGPHRYLEGEAVDLRFQLPGCAYVTGVEINGARLDTRPHTACDDVNPVDCQAAFYEIVWAVSRSDGTLDMIVRVHFSGPGSTGDVDDVTVIATSAVGQTRQTVPLSRVADVVAPNDARDRVVLGISETTLVNTFVGATYNRYGDYGRYVRDAETTLIEPNYGGTLLDLEPTGFHFVSRVTLDRTCHPQSRVEGRFILVKTDAGIEIQWTEGPFTPLTIDIGCNIVTLGLVDIIADYVYDAEVRETLNKEIQEQVDEALGDSCNALCRSQIVGFEYTDDELRVILRPSSAAVVIEVPYWRRVPPSITHGFPMSREWPVMLLGSGIARVSACRPGSTSPACGASHAVGAEGTFLWERAYDANNGSGIPDPWYNPGGPAVYYAQRDAARARLRGAYRDLDRLPSVSQNAGSVVFRGAGSRLRPLTRPCTYAPVLTDERVSFGVNDANDADYGTGTRRVAVVLAPIETAACL